MQRDYNVYLADIKDAIKKIERYTLNFSYTDFSENTLVLDAVIRNLAVIGEAVKQLPLPAKNQYPSMEWKKIAGLRDILIHSYFGINKEIIWDVVKNKLPELKKALQHIR